MEANALTKKGAKNPAAKQTKTHVVIRRQSQLRSEGSFMPEYRGRACHVCSDGHRPETKLIIRQQISGERKQKR